MFALRSLAAVVLLLILAGCGGAPPHFERHDLQGHFHVKSQPFCITVPKDWELREGLMGELLVGLAPVPKEGGFRVNVVISGVNVSGTASEAAEGLRKQALSELPAQLADFQEVAQVELHGFPALVYQHTALKTRVQVLSVYAARESQGYILTFTAPQGAYASWEGAFQESVGKFYPDKTTCPVGPPAEATPGHTPGAATPATETPAAAATETPAAPATETPATPATETPATPATETPATPATETPATPATETPAAPATETPAAPATETPATPALSTPATPTP